MDIFTFNDLPEAVSQIKNELAEIKEIIKDQRQPDPDVWLDVPELCQYRPDKPAKKTVYTEVQKRAIPFHRKGRKLVFLKSEIDAWLKQGRQKTVKEIEADQSSYLRDL